MKLAQRWRHFKRPASSKGMWKQFVEDNQWPLVAQLIPEEWDELSPKEDLYYQQGPFSTHEDFRGAKGGTVPQLVQPGPGRQGYDGREKLPPPDNYPGTQAEWEALDRKKRFRWRHPEDIKKWNLKRKEKGGDWFTSDFSKRKFDKTLLEKIEKEIVKENVKTGKTRTLIQLLTDAGVPFRMAKHPSLRKNRQIKKATKTFLSLPQKVNNYLENVVLNPNTAYDDIKYPMQHIAKKFSTDGTPLAHKTLIKYLEDNPLYKQNKNFLKYLGQGSAVYNKYGGTGKTIGDMMFIIDNRVPEPFFAVKGPDDFIMKSAYRSFMEGKQLGKDSSINFIGDPTMQNPSEWMFEHNGKIYAQNSALDKVDLPGDNRFHNKKINNLRIKDANKIYSKEFGEVYNIFDDLNKYRNHTLINPRTKNKSTLDWMTREAYEFERGYPRDKIGVQIDHGKGLKKPFTNLRLMNREMNQTAGNIIRQHGKTNPELAERMLNEIGYNKPYNYDEFIKSETDRVLKVLDPKNFDKAGNYIGAPRSSLYKAAQAGIKGGPTLSAFGAGALDDLIKSPGAKKTIRGLGWLLGPADVVIEGGMALPALARGNPQMARRSTTPGVFGSYGGTMLEDIKGYSEEAYRYGKAMQDVNEWNALEEDIQRAQKVISGEIGGYPEVAKTDLAEAKKKQALLEKNFSPTKDDDFQALQDVMAKMAQDSRKWSGDTNWLGQERGEQSTQESLEAAGVKPIDAHMMMQNADTTDEWRRKHQLEELDYELGGLDVETFLDPYGLKTQDPRYSNLPLDVASDYGSWEAKQARQKLEQLRNIDPGASYSNGGIVSLLKK